MANAGSQLPASLYAETAAPAPETFPLDGDRRVSIAVVGGGYTGLSTALHLAERGADVTLIEAHDIGWGCSGRNGGQVNPGLKPSPDQVERDFGADLGGRMVALSHGGPDFVFGLIDKHGIACEARRGGTLRAAASPSAARALAGVARDYLARSMPVVALDRSAVAAATGTGRYQAAMLDRRGGSLHPLSYARGLARAAIVAGADIRTGTRALRLRRGARGWSIKTTSGTLTADRVVLGANGYTDDLWPRLRQTIIPVYSAIMATEPLPQETRARILPKGSVLFELGYDTVYYRLDEAGRLLMGGRGPQREPRGPADYAHLAAYAERLWPGLKGVRWTHRWAGQVAITGDHYPHLIEPEADVHLALGYNGRGIAMATTMGALIARRIFGAEERDIDMPILRDVKPFRLHEFWRVGVTARIAYGRLRDRIGV